LAFVLLGLDGVSNRASFSGNCRLEIGFVSTGTDLAKNLGKKRRLESIAVVCFV
jgi:hypothetical protein